MIRRAVTRGGVGSAANNSPSNLKQNTHLKFIAKKDPLPERLEKMSRHDSRMEKASDALAPGGRPLPSFSRIVANRAERPSQVLGPRPRQAVSAAAAVVNQPGRAVAARNIERPRDTGHNCGQRRK